MTFAQARPRPTANSVCEQVTAQPPRRIATLISSAPDAPLRRYVALLTTSTTNGSPTGSGPRGLVLPRGHEVAEVVLRQTRRDPAHVGVPAPPVPRPAGTPSLTPNAFPRRRATGHEMRLDTIDLNDGTLL